MIKVKDDQWSKIIKVKDDQWSKIIKVKDDMLKLHWGFSSQSAKSLPRTAFL